MKLLEKAITEESRKTIDEDRADVIVLNSGRLMGLTTQIQNEISVPVIDPTVTALKKAETIVKLGLS